MKIKIEIRRNEDGAIAAYSEEVGANTFDPYVWETGNFSCDCNRGIFFYDALGLYEPEDLPCGNTAFSTRISDYNTDEVLYDELEKPSGTPYENDQS